MRPLILAAVLPLAACSMGSGAESEGTPGTGSGNARNYAVADFTSVDLRGSDTVEVRVGTPFAVRAEGDSALLDRLVIEKRGEVLRIGRRSESGFSWGSHGGARIVVTMPTIAGASVSGSGDLTVDTVKGASFGAALGGSGKLSITSMEVDSASFAIGGSGSIAAAGTARQARFSIGGSGDVDAGRLAASEANVSIAGSGSVTAAVDGPAKVSIVGSGDADLGPKARCTTSKLGSGEVRCGG